MTLDCTGATISLGAYNNGLFAPISRSGERQVFDESCDVDTVSTANEP